MTQFSEEKSPKVTNSCRKARNMRNKVNKSYKFKKKNIKKVQTSLAQAQTCKKYSEKVTNQ